MDADQSNSLKQILGLETDLEYLQRVAGPRAAIMTMNRIKNRAKTQLTRKITSDSRYLPMEPGRAGPVNAAGNPLPSGIKQKHIRKRIVARSANKNHPYATMIGYIKPIPAISLMQTKQRGTGNLITKGTVIRKKTTGPRAKVQMSRLSGVKIGGVVLPNSFLQIIAQGLRPHIFHRKQFKTWNPGFSGWMFHNKRRGIRRKSPPGARAPYDIVKFNLSKVFNRHFLPVIEETTEKHWVDEYDRALGIAAGRILGNQYKVGRTR